MIDGDFGEETGNVVLIDRFELLIKLDGHRMGSDLGGVEREKLESRERCDTREGHIRLSTLKHVVKREFDTIECHSLTLVDADRICETERELKTRCLDLISEHHLPAFGADLSHTSRRKTDKRIRITLSTTVVAIIIVKVIVKVVTIVVVVAISIVSAIALSWLLLGAVEGPLGRGRDLGVARVTRKGSFAAKADHDATRSVDKTLVEAEVLEEHDLSVDLDLKEGRSSAMVGDHITKVWLSRVDGRVGVGLASDAAELLHVFELDLFAMWVKTGGLDAIVVGDVCVDARFEDLKVLRHEIARSQRVQEMNETGIRLLSDHLLEDDVALDRRFPRWRSEAKAHVSCLVDGWQLEKVAANDLSQDHQSQQDRTTRSRI